jgi:hypothetical protein
MLEREVQHHAPADRTAHGDRSLERERVQDREDDVDVVACGEAVFLVLPAGGRRGFAVPGEIEGDDAEIRRHPRVIHQGAELAAVGAGGVQA